MKVHFALALFPFFLEGFTSFCLSSGPLPWTLSATSKKNGIQLANEALDTSQLCACSVLQLQIAWSRLKSPRPDWRIGKRIWIVRNSEDNRQPALRELYKGIQRKGCMAGAEMPDWESQRLNIHREAMHEQVIAIKTVCQDVKELLKYTSILDQVRDWHRNTAGKRAALRLLRQSSFQKVMEGSRSRPSWDVQINWKQVEVESKSNDLPRHEQPW